MKRLFWIILVLCGKMVQAQNFEEVNYIGACGSEDWTKGWTDFTPIAEAYPEADVPLQGIISRNTTLNAAHTYRLTGKVYVTNNATLYIEPGTIVRADFKSALVITPGAKIRALGTKEKPIIFTSAQVANQRNKGDWSGIVLLGRAKVNTASGKGVAEGDLDPLYASYGGSDDLDNSGVIRYVRVEFGGRRINKDHEFNGIAFYAVGSGTEVDYLMSSYSGDDGIQFFGGSVNCKHLVSFQSADDCFEYSEGYHGKQQFGISLRHFNLGDVSGSRSIDGQSSMSGTMHLETPTTATISNFTLISPEIFYEQVPNANIKDAMHYEAGAAYSVFNSIVIGFPTGIAIDGEESINFVQSGQTKIQNNLFVGCSKPAVTEPKTFDINSWFVNPAYNNLFRPKNDAPKLFVQAFSIFKPDFTTNHTSFLVKPSYKVLNAELKNEAPVLEQVSFAGAFNNHDWMLGWTSFNPDQPYTPDEIISGNITSNTTWVSDKIYLLKGRVEVKNGSTLTIEPGTVVLCDAETHASLLIEPMAQLKAEGEANSPIVFTSSAPVGKKQAGDWRGITLLGNGFIAPEAIKTASQINSDLPSSQLIGEGGFEGMVALRYVRVEYAGFSPDKKNQGALQVYCRTKSKTEIDFVQTSFSASDGFWFAGGDVVARHLIGYNTTDDDVVCSHGYYGTLQYAFNWRQPITAAFNGACSVEVLGCSASSCYPNRIATLSNFSILGPQRSSVSQINQNYQSGVLFKDGGCADFVNSLVTSYPAAFEISGSSSNFYFQSEVAQVRNVYLSDIKTAVKTDEKDPTLVIKKIYSEDLRKKNIAFDELKFKRGMTLDLLFLPAEGSPCLKLQSFYAGEQTW